LWKTWSDRNNEKYKTPENAFYGADIKNVSEYKMSTILVREKNSQAKTVKNNLFSE